MISSRTGERIYVGSSSMTLFGLEINKLVAPMMLNQPVPIGSPDSQATPPNSTSFDGSKERETVLEREGNAYRIMVGNSHSRPGINVNFTLPSYSYALLLVDTFVSYNDGCFYFFNEGLVKENLRRIYNDDKQEGFKPDYGIESLNNGAKEPVLETIWFCKLLLIFAVGEMYLGTANNLNGYKLRDKPKRKKHKSSNSYSAKLPGSGFFQQASDLFTGLFASGTIDNCAREGGIEVLLFFFDPWIPCGYR
ncbi:unnamed protein product [Ambrosiozyma monospora]|uniref:Unnamed protein product n=1 Tax=Ambrosiozyma monospora TaxID=43982 RepID=A0ACB5U640_AMBMO|nr:unnamed protein product [Ambrosiozyma monospora]